MTTTGKAWVKGAAAVAGTTVGLEAERERLAKAQADKIELELAVRRGELVDVEEVAVRWEKITGLIRQKLLGLPAKLTPALAMKPKPEIYTTLEGEIRTILMELSGGTANRAARRAAAKR